MTIDQFLSINDDLKRAYYELDARLLRNLTAN